MTRENKLALIVGFSLLLVVAVLLADHLSPAQREQLAALDVRFDAGPSISLPAGSGDQALRQFPTGEGDEQASRPAPRMLMIDPPTVAAQVNREIDELRQAAAELESGDGLRQSSFEEHLSRQEDAPKPLVMGTPVDDPAPVRTDRGDAAPYTVKDRDTLYGLCKQFYGDGSLYEKLARFNSDIVPSSGRIRTGMTLWIPSRRGLDGGAQVSGAGGSGQPPAAAAPAEVKTIQYTIREDDRLWDLAKAHLGKGHRWPEIVALNKDIIKNPDVLPIGRTIRIPTR